MLREVTMKLNNLFGRGKVYSGTQEETSGSSRKPNVPEGLFRKCNKCGAAIIAEDVKKGYYICPKCGAYFRVPARRRIQLITDEGSFCEWDADLVADNPMEYRGYEEKLQNMQEKTGLKEAVVTGKASIDGMDAVIGVCEGRFWMASMGWAVGEKITRAVERATKEKLPVILFCCSGGARMQEGITSLMQMAKTSAALKRHSDAGLLFISVLTDPTTGGVTASFAMLGDIILAEPGALIGFAGSRVIEQTIRQKLPAGFQRAEFLLEHGFLDGIVKREYMKETLGRILRLHGCGQTCSGEGSNTGEAFESQAEAAKGILEDEKASEDFWKCDENEKVSETFWKDGEKEKAVSAWERVQLSRRSGRPVGSNYVEALFSDFTEFHGDRCYGDDPAIIGGIASFHGQPVTVIVQAKGTNTKENLKRNFGMPSPEGYRKALRLMKQAEKFQRPILCFVDTPGAFCGIEAEERGQGEAIARNLFELSALEVPVLSVVIGEGGSGGALAMAVADEVWMLENSIYSVLSPEGFASILWKDSSKAKEAAAVMKLTAEDLRARGIIEKVIQEPMDYCEDNQDAVMSQLDREIREFLQKQESLDARKRCELRYERFRKM